jgi:hypothetical protein
VAPIAALGRHVLLLTATPLEDDTQGFFRLLQLLQPSDFPDGMDVEARLASGVPLPPCTSATRRVDIGGLPPREPRPVDLPSGYDPPIGPGLLARLPAANDPVSKRRTVDRIRRALASGAALKAVLGPEEIALRQQAEAMDRVDPRLEWLLSNGKRWRRTNEKTLVFVAHRETLEMLRDALSARAQLASGVFHEELSAARRDTEVARFRAEDGPSIATGSCSTTCPGSPRPSSSVLAASIGSAVASRSKSSISDRRPASVPTSSASSSGSDCSANRSLVSNLSSRTSRKRSRRARSDRTGCRMNRSSS